MQIMGLTLSPEQQNVMEHEVILSPAQQTAADCLLNGIPVGDVFVLRSAPGMGRSTILRKVHSVLGGAFVGVRQFIDALSARQPEAIEEAFLNAIEEVLASNNLVTVDDLHLVTSVVDNCDYPRSYLLDAALTAMLGEASARKKKLVFGVDHGDAPWPVRRRAYSWDIAEFQPADYECICRAHLDRKAADKLDYAKIHRFAPMLNAHQLKNACAWLRREAGTDTKCVIEYLRSENMVSNVEINESQPVNALLAEAGCGLTGADLEAVVEDGK
jgi:hypothetical protein